MGCVRRERGRHRVRRQHHLVGDVLGRFLQARRRGVRGHQRIAQAMKAGHQGVDQAGAGREQWVGRLSRGRRRKTSNNDRKSLMSETCTERTMQRDSNDQINISAPSYPFRTCTQRHHETRKGKRNEHTRKKQATRNGTTTVVGGWPGPAAGVNCVDVGCMQPSSAARKAPAAASATGDRRPVKTNKQMGGKGT